MKPRYHRRMTLPSRLLVLPLLATLACGDNSSGTEESSTTAPVTTGEPGTTGTTGEPTTGDASSTTGAPPSPGDQCTALASEAACKADAECEWKGVVEYDFGAQGCQGGITNYCVDKTPAGGATAWYREVAGDTQVVEFGYAPALGPEWTECSCDGPLACLCTSVTEDCPDRLVEYCGAVTTAIGCGAVNIKGDPRCAWLSVSPEGPKDLDCADSAQKDLCLPADNAGATTCTPPAYDFGNCAGYPNEIYWREVAGIIEVTTACGPAPLGFTRCEGVDTPDQPDECRCRCL